VTIKVLLADDQQLVRTGFRVLIESEPDLEVVGEAATGREAVDVARRTQPDVVVMDIRMPDMDGLAATVEILDIAALRNTRVLILTTFEIDEYVFQALQAGASGFVGKGVDADALVKAIHTIHDGDALLSAAATKTLISRFLTAPAVAAAPKSLETLTNREREVLTLVAAGWTNDEIAQHLVVSPATTKTHINRTMTKLGVRDRAQLVVIAYQTGLVRPGVV
jgi:DNA-binding NarL/FixJ family response regulator